MSVSSRMITVADSVALRVIERPGEDDTPWVLVHGLASSARMWDGVADRLAAWGHPVAAVDLRGHGQSDRPAGGYDTMTSVEDLVAIINALGWTTCAVAGQSWGGNVVMELAASGKVDLAGIACIDGGWIDLGRRFQSWADCERHLAPPDIAGRTWDDLERGLRRERSSWPEEGIQGFLACFERVGEHGIRARLDRGHHLAILRSLWERDPAEAYPRVSVPVLLVPAASGEGLRAEQVGSSVSAAESVLARARVLPLTGDHDLHAQQPEAIARLLHDASTGGWPT